MSHHCRMAGAKPIPILLTSWLLGGICFAQTYQLGSDVIDDGGVKLTSSGYILRGSFGQPTIGKISSSSYQAIIGFWHPPYAVPGVAERSQIQSYVPVVFSLSQNYPNPFSHITTIPYSVPGCRGAGVQRGDLSAYPLINLSVYDVCGRLVRTLVDEPQEPGYYRVTWDLRGVFGNRLPNGVYFYRLKARQFVRTRKMVVLR